MAVQRRFALPMIAATVLVAVVLAGCSGSSQGPIELTAAENGSTQNLAVGQELRITLQSNQTTGYRWDIDGALPAQLEQVGEPSYSSTSTLVGGGGAEVWTFKGKASGTGELKLKYWRSFEPSVAPADVFSVTVNVE